MSSSIFKMGPAMLGPASLAAAHDSSRRPNWGETRWDEERENRVYYCDPAVDPNCQVLLAGDGNRSFKAESSSRETPPTERCNPAWDPACPRPLPNRTMVPYLPSSYLMGVLYSPAGPKPRPRDRSGRLY